MHGDGRNAGQTKALAYGGLVCWVAVIGGAFLFGATHHLAARMALVAISALLLGEGVGLMTNWRGGANEVAAIIRGRPPVRGSLVAMHLGKKGFIRNTIGPTAVVLGGIFLWAAVR
ncbi:MAG TPA: hypothetical protein VEH55_02095 [Gaiellaceae bacterium]|nr:hypothetical protein [Gaiellaceae bacterium]